MKDFTPTKESISLHGLGFIQLILPNEQRLHVWHPDLPRRKCFDHSPVHNHRFAFESRVIKGTQYNQRYYVEIVKDGACELISHNGPRSTTGSRVSCPVAQCNLIKNGPVEMYNPSETYIMDLYEYHETITTGIVITLMKKTEIGVMHANSVITKGMEFDYDFDRFQFTPTQLYDFVVDAFKS